MAGNQHLLHGLIVGLQVERMRTPWCFKACMLTMALVIELEARGADEAILFEWILSSASVYSSQNC